MQINRLLLFFLLLSQKAECQSMEILDMNSTVQRISIKPNYIENRLCVILGNGNDSLIVNGFTDLLGQPKIEKKKFLLIEYKIRAGVDIKERKLLILTARKDKIIESFHVTSFQTADVNKVYNKAVDSSLSFDEHSSYVIKSKLLEKGENTFLSINLKSEKKSKITPKSNYRYENTYQIKFDKKKNIFYTASEKLKDRYVIESFNADDKQIKVEGYYPKIQIGSMIYYFMNDSWFYNYGNNMYTNLTR